MTRFPEDEPPTKPSNPEYRAAMLVKAWRELSKADQEWLERLVALMAWGRKR